MEEQIIAEQVTLIFRKVLGDDTILISDNTTANDIEGWNSLSHVRLISEIEKAFGIQFAFADIMSFENVGDIVKGVRKLKLESRN